jgi:RNA-binding protein
MAASLTARERSALKARAHALEPVVQIGKGGVKDAVVAAVDRALTAHELIKVRIDEPDRHVRAALCDELGDRTGAAVVQRVGKIVVLWRPKTDEPGS